MTELKEHAGVYEDVGCAASVNLPPRTVLHSLDKNFGATWGGAVDFMGYVVSNEEFDGIFLFV
jgi:hypothetical protein